MTTKLRTRKRWGGLAPPYTRIRIELVRTTRHGKALVPFSRTIKIPERYMPLPEVLKRVFAMLRHIGFKIDQDEKETLLRHAERALAKCLKEMTVPDLDAILEIVSERATVASSPGKAVRVGLEDTKLLGAIPGLLVGDLMAFPDQIRRILHAGVVLKEHSARRALRNWRYRPRGYKPGDPLSLFQKRIRGTLKRIRDGRFDG